MNFVVINEGFKCVNCGKDVSKSEQTCRNHCPYCFVSLHVDENLPGDRKSKCGGLMYLIEYELSNGTIKLSFQCVKCGKIHKNKISKDDNVINLDKLLEEYKIKFI